MFCRVTERGRDGGGRVPLGDEQRFAERRPGATGPAPCRAHVVHLCDTPGGAQGVLLVPGRGEMLRSEVPE